MHKIKLILLLILPLSVLGQDLGIIDTKTTKNPAINGTHRISTDGKNLFFRNFFGLSKKVASTDSAVFTGTTVLPSNTTIGNVSATELGYLDGVTSPIQAQINSIGGNKVFYGTVDVTNAVSLTANIGDLYINTTSKAVYKKTNLSFPTGLTYIALASGTWVKLGNFSLTKNDVGLSDVDNTSDANKPISSATQTALNGKENTLTKGNITSTDLTITGGTNSIIGTGVTISLSSLGRIRHFSGAGDVTNAISLTANIGDIYFNTTNGTVYQKSNLSFPSGLTYITLASGTWVKLGDYTLDKSKVGLSNVDNTSDANKPISSATQTALDLKANITSPTFITDATTPRLKITGAGDIGKGSDLVMAGNSNDLTMHGTGKVILGTGGFQRLVVTNAGNVGVGTTAPVAKFEVSGLAGFRYNDGKQADGKYLRSNSTGVAAWDSVKVSEVFGLNTTYLPISNPTATGTLTAPTIANSLGANFATTSGNVGIGIASPAYKLDVSGTARFTGAATFTGGIFSFGSGGITSNTAIGFQALNSNTTGYQNIAIGNSSLSANTTGFNNTANGVNSLSANTTGVSNSAFGLNSLLSNTSGGKNTAIGEQSLSANTTGANNTAVGYFALSNNTTSYGNSAFGYQALIVNTTGQENTSIGFQSLYSNTTGSSNTAIGQQSLYSNTTGGINTSVGLNAGRFISGGSVANTITNNSIYLGGFTKALADNQTNQIVIGHNAVGNGSNTTVLGNTSITQTQIFGNTILSNTSQATDTGEKLQVNGTAKFVNGVNLATTSGNVGIGTTAPVAKLTVVGSDNAISMDAGVGGNPYLDFQQNGVQKGYLQYVNSGAYMRLVDAGIVGLVQKDGKIGIGTTSPAAKLNIEGTGYTSALIRTSTTTAGGLLTLSNTTRSYSLGARGDYSAGQFNIVDETAGLPRFSISSNGRVGIGTTTDAGYLLDVNGTARVTGNSIFSDNVGIGTTSPNASSILDITSTTKGVLFPRMTTAEISAIASPADGLTVYNTTLKAICFYDSSVAVWKKVSHSNM